MLPNLQWHECKWNWRLNWSLSNTNPLDYCWPVIFHSPVNLVLVLRKMITSFSDISPLTSPISNHLERQASRKRVCFCTCTLSSTSVAQKDRILCYGWSQDQCQSQSFKWQPVQRRPYVFSGFSESCYPRFTVTLNPVIWGHHTTRLTETFHCTHCSDVVILYLQTP